jgi:hypothetical protein
LIRRVEVGSSIVKIEIVQSRLTALLTSDSRERTSIEPTQPNDNVLTLTAPVRHTPVGREMKLLVDDGEDTRTPDISLLRVIARAHDIQRRLAADTMFTAHDIAREERVTSGHSVGGLWLSGLCTLS